MGVGSDALGVGWLGGPWSCPGRTLGTSPGSSAGGGPVADGRGSRNPGRNPLRKGGASPSPSEEGGDVQGEYDGEGSEECDEGTGAASPSEDEGTGEYEGEGHGGRSARGRVHHGRADAGTAAMAADATADTQPTRRRVWWWRGTQQRTRRGLKTSREGYSRPRHRRLSWGTRGGMGRSTRQRLTGYRISYEAYEAHSRRYQGRSRVWLDNDHYGDRGRGRTGGHTELGGGG